jgi:hypothetical protein
MKRREFLKLVPAAVVAIAGGSGCFQEEESAISNVLEVGPEPYLSIIRQHLPMLKVEVAEIENFKRAFERNSRPHRAGHGDEDLAKDFLLSTDFFENGEDESVPLRFVSVFNPRLTPCYNPLTNL